MRAPACGIAISVWWQETIELADAGVCMETVCNGLLDM